MNNPPKPPSWPPTTPESESEWFSALIALVRHLRGPQGCPWDRQQSAIRFAEFVREETGELIEALANSDAECVAEEWGDTLFTLLAAAAAAEEEGVLNVREAMQGAHAKLIRRHAHIFGGREAGSPEEVAAMWAAIKSEEKAERHARKSAQ